MLVYRAGVQRVTAAATITVLAGGVGAARMLRALSLVADPATITAVVNTADDAVMHGLHISPDIDTVVYSLGGAIDPERGWGLAGETWEAMGALARFAAIRPTGSGAGGTWFNLGDRDLATHLYRTGRLAEGATMTEVTAELAAAWGVTVGVVPMTDGRVRTRLTLPDGRELGFQEYFVEHRHSVEVAEVRFAGADTAVLTAAARAALGDGDVVVIAPSNPVVSIGPIRALPGVDELLAGRRDTVVAVSPIVGGAALKGPADRLLAELGFESSVVGVARLYAPIAGVLVIDPVDAGLADAVRAEGLVPVITPSVMSTPDVARTLSTAVLAAGGIPV